MVKPFVCKSTAMVRVAGRIERAARAECPVLICGEPGTGKKLAAEIIHRRSRRSRGSLVIVRAESLSGQPLEEQLFDTSEQIGDLARADGGTLLIDEITRIPLTGQARLLGATEGRRFGSGIGEAVAPSDFRLIATTCSNLAESVKQGAVRNDLYYRLAAVTIRVPSLRDRKADIPFLVEEMLGELCSAQGKPPPAVSAELMECLVNQSWPDNARGLRDCLQRMTVLEDVEMLDIRHFRASRAGAIRAFPGSSSVERVDTMAELEHAAVLRALRMHQNNRTQAAKTLGISVRTLQRKLKNWGV
jgi:DNA-binding NtrC family response regulator